MSDIATIWDAVKQRGDYQLAGASLASSQDLYTAVLISLFTDRLADPDDVILDGTQDPRGWVGDDGQYLIGSRLWLLDRTKLLPNTLQKAYDYCVEALQWMLDDQVVSKIDVTVDTLKVQNVTNGIIIYITLYRQDGSKLPAMKFDYVWQQAFGV